MLIYAIVVTILLVCVIIAAIVVARVLFSADADSATFQNKRGGELAQVKAIKMKDGNLTVKSVLLGSMPETIYVKPDELLKMASLMDKDVLKAMPGFILRGRKALRESNAAAVEGSQR